MHMMARAAVAALAVLLLALPTPGTAGTMHQRELPADTAPASREREYQVYIPDGLPTDGSAPLVTVLHGCRQSEENMIAETRFRELADTEGFVVAYPFVTSFAELRIENCWGFWFPQHRTEGSGEASDIRRIIAAVEDEFGTDPTRRYITGLSSGGAMSAVVAVAYSEDIAAAGAVAGLPYGEDASAVGFVCSNPAITNTIPEITAAMAAEQTQPEEKRLVPMMVVHSINDCTVPIVNGSNLRDSWISYYGADTDPAAELDCQADGVSCTQSRYADDAGATVVETVIYTGQANTATHYWPGDNPGQFANPDGPSATDHLWAFFQDKSLQGAAAVQFSISEVTVENGDVRVAGTAQAEAGVTGVALRLDGTPAVAEQPADLAADGSWAALFEAVPLDRFYTPIARITLGDGTEVTRTGEPFPVGNPVEIVEVSGTWQQHLAAQRIGQPASGCPNQTFGVCDRDFTALFFEHGFEPFPLFALEATGTWYADRTNVDAGT